jgi:hypothetical protein
LPDISKINALAIGSVSKVDGLSKASILDIDGVAVPSGVAPAVAYSVRLLGSAVGISSYTGDCMRVRRASDNVEADVGFDAGELKLTSPISNTSDGLSYTDFADFVDHTGTPTDAFCRTWYDQSGNSNDVGQSTAGSQPKIYDATTGLITENGKPALDFDGSNDFMTSAAITSTGDQTFAFVTKADTTSQTGIVASSLQRALFIGGGNAIYQSSQSTENDKNYGSYTTSQMLHFVYHDNTTTSDSFGRINTTQNALDPSVNGKWDDVILGRYDETSALNYNGNIQEFIFWTGDQSGNVTGIESDINGFFSIYP